jgi:hypothetical protein
MGVSWPSPKALYYLLIDEYRGLFFGAPWLLLAIPGALLLVRDRRLRDPGLVVIAVSLAYLWLASSLSDWHGGWGMGPRHLIATLPFLTLGAGACLAWASRAPKLLGRATFLVWSAGAAYSAVLMLAGTAVKPEVPRAIERPFTAFLVPALSDGRLAINTQSIDMVKGREGGQRFAWNWGERAGMNGLGSLAPLGVFVALAGSWLFAAHRSRI